MRRRLFLFVLLQACSTGSTSPDGGTDASADASSDAAFDGAGDASDAAALSAPEALDQAGKLALWLEAASSQITLGDGGVSAWKDKSKNHNDATATTGTPSYQSAVVAGHDAVHFDGFTTALSVSDAPSLQLGTDPVHVVAVARLATLRSFFFSKTAPNDAGFAIGLNFFIANGGSTDASPFSLSPYASVDNVDSVTWGGANELADGKFHIVSFRRPDTTHLEVWIDDLAPKSNTTTVTDISAAGQPLTIGPISGPQTPDFSLAEELVVRGGTDADVASVHAYLKQKYGL